MTHQGFQFPPWFVDFVNRTTPEQWSMYLKVSAVLVPVLGFTMIAGTVRALHRRDVYFWSLASTWTSIMGSIFAFVLFIMGGQVTSFNGDPFWLFPGLGLYACCMVFALVYNYRATRSVFLAVFTLILQNLAVSVCFLLWLRFFGQGHREEAS